MGFLLIIIIWCNRFGEYAIEMSRIHTRFRLLGGERATRFSAVGSGDP